MAAACMVVVRGAVGIARSSDLAGCTIFTLGMTRPFDVNQLLGSLHLGKGLIQVKAGCG